MTNHVYLQMMGWKEWPAVVVCHEDCGKRPPVSHSAWVFWFNEYRVSQISLMNMVDIQDKAIPPKSQTSKKPLREAILERLEEARRQSGLVLHPLHPAVNLVYLEESYTSCGKSSR